jgi:hypothetical protein
MTGRGLEGRQTARAMIALTVLCGVATVLAWVAVPGLMGAMSGPMIRGPEPWFAPLIPVAGVASYFVGLGWMVRIYRANPEPDTKGWRYRDL